MLSSGGSRKSGVVMRRIRGKTTALPAPELARDYHRWMGGVDVNDQLRLQRYSVQLSYKTRKYYKTLFLSLLAMALVNAFIVNRHFCKMNNKTLPKHYAFFETLMEQLLAVDDEAFETILVRMPLVFKTGQPLRQLENHNNDSIAVPTRTKGTA
ncbi:Hypothetical protein PHPALM_37652 [Phytophthora palmivora]|uniref:PiggyBac transposable element-derived protein domain-containing protein n=1 Tax=Phytophthora palmivora TaxID=4796 RepID=A0A2P4WWV9_9STRA|nr:Hypothetical protein PHPALM_37652 [Phytophthora palmivora]